MTDSDALALLQQRFARLEHLTGQMAYVEECTTMFEWRMLAERFVPARAALQQARDEQAACLLGGDLSFGRIPRFSLIEEINRSLGDEGSTSALFVQLDATHPELARRCAARALEALVNSGQFALAERYRGDPLSMLEPVNENAHSLPLYPPAGEAPRLLADLSMLVRDVGIGIAVLRGLGRGSEADALRTALLAGLESGELAALARRELNHPGTILDEIRQVRR